MKTTTPLALAAALAVSAACTTTDPSGTVTVHADPGGLVADRMRDIAEINRAGTTYRIAGDCASSCPMLLDLDNVCVEPDARLGFKGPAHYFRFAGVSLFPIELDETGKRLWSHQMAQHYPEPIRTKFLNEWSKATHKVTWITGLEAHRMAPGDVRLC